MDNERTGDKDSIHRAPDKNEESRELRPRILIADDIESNRIVLSAMLSKMGYEVIHASDGREALEKAKDTPPDLVLLDIMMPGMDGFEALKHFKEEAVFQSIPIVMVTALDDLESRVAALEHGADDFLTKPVERSELRARAQSLLKVKAYNDHMRNYQKKLEQEVEKKTAELRKAFNSIKEASLETIFRLSKAAEFRDIETGNHIQRVSGISASLATRLGLDSHTVVAILCAAPMHDIGKIGIPDSILLKPGKLDLAEWDIMKRHSEIGAQILEGSKFEFIKVAGTIALCHHERWDGSGYPRKLQGEEIPIEGRITAIADVFDALMSKRPYKDAFTLEQSLKIIRDSSGTHLDPHVIGIFFEIQEEILSIREKLSD